MILPIILNTLAHILVFYLSVIFVLVIIYTITTLLFKPMKTTIEMPRFEILDLDFDFPVGHGHFLPHVGVGVGVREIIGARARARARARDDQNVHDVIVQKSIVDSIGRLKQKTRMKIMRKEVINGIRNTILICNDSTEKTKIDALSCIDKIQSMNVYIYNLDMKELDILDLVWNFISQIKDEQRQKVLKENLVSQLADCITSGTNTKCAQGRVSRILQSIETGEDSDIVKITPFWAIKQQITSLIPIYINRLLPEKYKKIYQSDLEKHEPIINKLNKMFIEKIDRKLRKDFLNNKGFSLSEKEYNSIVMPCYENM